MTARAVPAVDVAGPVVFGLHWPGKAEAFEAADAPATGQLNPPLPPDRPFEAHLCIAGDNLDVLRLLQARAEAQVDLIYIDPPYNTGNAFVFNDAFRGRGDTVAVRRHAEWLSMMAPRLVLARRLLAHTGAIFVSIDANEMAHLRLLMDEVFGRSNHIADIAVSLNPKGRQLGPHFATSHEYLLVYARDAGSCRLDAASADLVDERDFPLQTPDGRRYRRLPLRNTNKKFNPRTAPTMHYELWADPDTGHVATSPFAGARAVRPVFGDGTDAVWRWSAARVDERPGDLVARMVRGRLGERCDIFQKDWLGTDRKKKLRTVWTAAEVGSTDTAVAEVKRLIGPYFNAPKPLGLLERILRTAPADALVLDFFAGSGTTSHAVMRLNAADGGARRSIAVNLPEPLGPGTAAAVAGLRTVSDITELRLRAAAAETGDPMPLEVLRLEPGPEPLRGSLPT